jgi:transcriptional regulator with XRE-family HTH domain
VGFTPIHINFYETQQPSLNKFPKLEEIPNIIKTIRKKSGLSQQSLSEKLKFLSNYISYYENPKKPICPLGHRYLIAKYFKMTYEQLCVNQGELNILNQYDKLYPKLFPDIKRTRKNK